MMIASSLTRCAVQATTTAGVEHAETGIIGAGFPELLEERGRNGLRKDPNVTTGAFHLRLRSLFVFLSLLNLFLPESSVPIQCLPHLGSQIRLQERLLDEVDAFVQDTMVGDDIAPCTPT